MCLIVDNRRLCFTLFCVFKQVKYAQHGRFKEKNSENCGKLQQAQGNQMQFLVNIVELLPGLSLKFNAVTAGVCIFHLKTELRLCFRTKLFAFNSVTFVLLSYPVKLCCWRLGFSKTPSTLVYNIKGLKLSVC